MKLLLTTLLGTLSFADAGQAAMSPVTRVVQLLEGMSKRIEQDGKDEEDLYETFVCWAKSIISQKGKSNTAAQSRVDYLTTYIDDLQSGRIELTSERVDLEKEIETLTGDIEVATQLREKEAKDYDVAKTEMEQAIDALEKAIEVLNTATRNHTKGSLLDMKVGLGEGNAARAKEAIALNHAVELGEKVLTKGDSIFLSRLLTGEVPERASWKKLNRKATFKMDYKARSFKIQGVLSDLLKTFSADLADATKKEEKAIELFNELMGTKGQEKSDAQEALFKMDEEGGARQLSMGEATTEKEALEGQISADEGYIGQVEQALSDKKAEWKTRKALRADELAAVSKAISILRADDARDVIKRSYESQGLFFVQEHSHSQVEKRVQNAAEALRSAARMSRDSRLQTVVSTMLNGHFDEVIGAIDSMISTLASEETTDLQNKETCESNRKEDTRTAIKLAREMDDLTDKITSLRAKIAETAAEIQEKQDRVEEIAKEVEEITEQRGKEHQEFLRAKQDDEEAAGLVLSAKTTLSTFYTENGLMGGEFLQGKKGKQPFKSVAGEAPPPPPKTWEAPYGGKTEESTGILAIMDMIHDDMVKDKNKAIADEADAVALFEKTTNRLGNESSALTIAIGEMNGAKSEMEGDVVNAITPRGTKSGELATEMQAIAAANPGCDFLTVNFPIRSKNRQIEMDGLEKAKAILKGGRFDAKDPNRELKPGDAAFVQGHLRAGRKIHNAM